MTHKRNIAGLLASAKQRSTDAEDRAEKAIRTLIKSGRPINFNTVAQTADVSVPWCYNHPRIRQRVASLREQTRKTGTVPIPLSERQSDASKDAIIATLKRRVSELNHEVAELRKQVEVAYGKLAIKDS